MKLEKILLNGSRHNWQGKWDELHNDYDNALDYIIDLSKVNIYDIRRDGDYEELLQPYFRDSSVASGIYKFNPDVVFDQYPDEIYDNMWTDFMKPEMNRVEYLLNKKVPVLIYNGQDDLIVETPGTMKWVDRIYYSDAEDFRKKLFSSWVLNGKVVGAFKTAGLLELRIVFNAGHMVPMDRPEEALDLVTSFVNRVARQ